MRYVKIIDTHHAQGLRKVTSPSACEAVIKTASGATVTFCAQTASCSGPPLAWAGLSVGSLELEGLEACNHA